MKRAVTTYIKFDGVIGTDVSGRYLRSLTILSHPFRGCGIIEVGFGMILSVPVEKSVAADIDSRLAALFKRDVLNRVRFAKNVSIFWVDFYPSSKEKFCEVALRTVLEFAKAMGIEKKDLEKFKVSQSTEVLIKDEGWIEYSEYLRRQFFGKDETE